MPKKIDFKRHKDVLAYFNQYYVKMFLGKAEATEKSMNILFQ